MGVVIPSSFGQITWKGFHGSTGQLWACTMGIDVTGGITDPTDLATRCYDAWDENINPVLSSSTALTACNVKLGPGNLGPQAQFDLLRAGQVDAPTLPSNVAILVQKRTAAGGRANRGRMFIPGMPEGSVTNGGLIDSAILLAWDGAFFNMKAQLLADLQIDGLVVLHDESSPVALPTPITDLRVQSMVATMRRRLRR